MPGRIVIHALGDADVLRWEEIDLPQPGPGEVLLRQTAVGLNYIDVYFRTGLYPAGSTPFLLGMEGAGIVETVGEGVGDLVAGDRVAYAGAPLGSYAEARTMPAERLVKLPAEIEDRVAAAIMLKGMTTEYLLQRAYPVRAGDTILVHAAAGGVGLLACQWAKALGARVIGTVGSEEKAALAKVHGCDHPVLYRNENVVERVRSLTDGRGVPVVYDSVGKDTFDSSLDCLAPLGTLVLFGQASGKVPPFDLGTLSQKGSLFVTRPTLASYTASREDLLASAQAVFDKVTRGVVSVEIGQTYPLREAAQAHRDLEARKTTGSTVLLP